MASASAVQLRARLLAAAVAASAVHGQFQRLPRSTADGREQTLGLMNATLLTLSPFLMAHDAGSGYLGDGIVNAWTKTQSGGLRQQLDCGARAFDARPTMHPKYGLIWHHGVISIHYGFETSLVNIISWCEAHPSELVLLLISQCTGTGCLQAVRDVLSKHDVHDLYECDMLSGLTYADAKALAALPKGGSLLAVTGPPAQSGGVACSVGNYDSSQTCVGFVRHDAPDGWSLHACGSGTLQENTPTPTEPLLTSAEIALLQECARNGSIAKEDISAAYGCWKADASQTVPVDRMLKQLDAAAAAIGNGSHFTQMQALWQESAWSVIVGTMRDSSLLKDETKSGLNSMLEMVRRHPCEIWVRSKRWAHINFLEVNNICDGGPRLLDALRPREQRSL